MRHDKSMKKIFQKWLFVFVLIAFLITFGISWRIHSRLAREATISLIRTTLKEASGQVIKTQNNLQTIIKLSDAAALAKTRALAQIVAADQSIITNATLAQKVCDDLDVDEIHVSDETGLLICSIPQSYKGYRMDSQDQSRPFMEAVTNSAFELVQSPMLNGYNDRIQYAGVARLDAPGIIQIGYKVKRIEEFETLADVSNIAQAFKIGHSGYVTIAPKRPELHFKERIFNQTINGKNYVSIAVPSGNYILTGSLPEKEMYLSRNSVLQVIVLANIILFGIIFILVSILLQKVVIKGIYSVNDSLNKITNGDLSEKVNVETTTEFIDLSTGINSTVNALKESIKNEAKRINRELEMGRIIQSSVLPLEFPATDNYRLHAAMFAAKEVGGDFYDFFKISDEKLAIIISDVSGKGISAALYMMNSKALIKDLVQSEVSLEIAVRKANEELCKNNKAHMFLTSFIAILDLKTGNLECVNAGHNPPLIKNENGEWEYLKIKHGIPLSIMAKAKYTAVNLTLKPGTSLLLYTDGVTEAKNREGKLFGEDRLITTVSTQNGTPAQIISTLKETIDDYSTGCEQSDDITMLSIDFIKPME